MGSGPELTGALNASKPIEKPQTHRASDVENHLADSNHQIAVRCCRRHLASPSMLEIVSEVREFLDTQKPVCYSKFLSWRLEQHKETHDKKLKNFRHYSFGRYGCQYHSGRVSDPLLL